MLNSLRERERRNEPIRVVLVGAGAMGLGIALQLKLTPGMKLVAVVDIDLDAGREACVAYGDDYELVPEGSSISDANKVWLAATPADFMNHDISLKADVLVESTNTIGFALQVCRSAFRRKMHVVLMNAEVDLAFGPLLRREAQEHGVHMTSDAGDQHGVLATMIEEIELWGFDIKMAGNIKGFLRRHATADSLKKEAEIRNLNPIQCCAYTDGTKLNIEMAVMANALGMKPFVRGMEGPEAKDVREVFDKFDFDRYTEGGVVDYILGAEPGGGVFVVGHHEAGLQARYLEYYKLGDGPYYLFYRPYHLCHLETPKAIWLVCDQDRPLLAPDDKRLTDVFAFAKRDLAQGDHVNHAIGGDEVYGLIDTQEVANKEGLVPIWLLESELPEKPRFKRSLRKDQALTWDDIEIPACVVADGAREQIAKTGLNIRNDS